MTKGKAVRDSKAGTLAPKESRTAEPSNNANKVEVTQGNVGMVTCSLLNALNNNMAAVRQILERLEKKLDG
jgi:hypothetical protein